MSSSKNNQHGGDAESVAKQLGVDPVPEIKLDFSVNVNPLGPPRSIDTIVAAEKLIEQYPEIHADKAAFVLAEAHKVDSDCVIVSNGSTEAISWILQALKISKAAIIPPCYSGYKEICSSLSIESIELSALDEDLTISLDKVDTDADILFLTSPNNPTGSLLSPEEILALAQRLSDVYIVVDESFMDFVEDSSELSLINRNISKNIIVIKSLTKFFAIPGLRLGMTYAHKHTAELLKAVRTPWSVNAIAQGAAVKLYDDKAYLDNSRKAVKEMRDYLIDRISSLGGFSPFPSEANYILVRLQEDLTAGELQKKLLQKNILIRSCENYSGLGKQFIRLAVRSKNEVDKLIDAISGNSDAETSGRRPIMVVGTTSDAGKSIVAAGLCRLFHRKGIKTAPFKAQNMALNSYVTSEGGEMGRAQVVQAEAAEIPPHTDMNPVLLKPMGSAGSQVIVNGKPIGNFPAKEYYEMKQQMRAAAHAAFERLAEKYELIILEGAGSPTEINLMEEDFVNMAMAEYAGADVILVADIDRGGVFATIYGTIRLLPEKYRRLIKGIIINKFRGDESLLESGIKQIEELTNVPVLGILPYMHEMNIEEEDSLGLEKRLGTKPAIIDIAVIRLPAISNYTDFLALENTAGVSVRYITRVDELGEPDLVILPGTKNTRADLNFMQDNGIADAVMDLAHKKVPVFGICGGYQMLGARISDPTGVEGEPGDDIGLNLLPLNTVLEPEKELAQVEGVIELPLPFARPHTPVSGYEIHAGRTSSSVFVDQPLLITKRRSENTNEAAGSISEDGLIFGSYIHGIFDSDPLRTQILDWLCAKKNIEPIRWTSGKSNDFDTLADIIENKIDLSIIGDPRS